MPTSPTKKAPTKKAPAKKAGRGRQPGSRNKATIVREQVEQLIGRKLEGPEVDALRLDPDGYLAMTKETLAVPARSRSDQATPTEPSSPIDSAPPVAKSPPVAEEPLGVRFEPVDEPAGRHLTEQPLVVFFHDVGDGDVEGQNVTVVHLPSIRELPPLQRYSAAVSRIDSLNAYRRTELVTRTIKELHNIAGEALGV